MLLVKLGRRNPACRENPAVKDGLPWEIKTKTELKMKGSPMWASWNIFLMRQLRTRQLKHARTTRNQGLFQRHLTEWKQKVVLQKLPSQLFQEDGRCLVTTRRRCPLHLLIHRISLMYLRVLLREGRFLKVVVRVKMSSPGKNDPQAW